MQVKKFEANSVLEALQGVKQELGPDAIILSTQEAKRSVTGSKKFIVVAAVSESQLKKKQIAEQQLEKIYQDKVRDQPAQQQRMFIENVYRGIEKKHEARKRQITSTPYIEIDDSEGPPAVVAKPALPVESNKISGMARVRKAAHEAFKSSLNSEFFNESQQEDDLLDDEILHTIVKKSPGAALIAEPVVQMVRRLKACGVSPAIVDQLQAHCQRELGADQERRALVDSWFAKKILQQVRVIPQMCSDQVEVFVGPDGSGKTTSLVKLATHYVMQEHKKVAIVTTDLNKVGGVEQLRVYSRILNTPVYVVSDVSDLAEKIESLHAFDKVLVDTQGISLSNIHELDFMRVIANWKPQQGMKVHLVLSALIKESDLGGLLKRFRVAQFDDVIVTNADQTSQHGILLNIQSKMDQPFHSFGIGSDIVDGFEIASRERVLDLIFKLTRKIGDRGHDNRI